METSPLICSANQWAGFYIITAFVMKGLKSDKENHDFILRSNLCKLLQTRDESAKVSSLFRITFTLAFYKLFWIGVKV